MPISETPTRGPPVVIGSLCFPTDDAGRLAVYTADTPASLYPASNLLDNRPSVVCKSTTTTLAVTATLPGDRTLVAVSLHNTNSTTSSITNAAGLNKSIVVPAVDLAGQRLGGWADLSAEAFPTDDAFVVHLSVASGVVWIGRVALWTVARDVQWSAGRDEGTLWPGDVAIQTRLGEVDIDHQAIRQRWFDLTFVLDEDRALFLALDAASVGAVLPFPVIPDVAANDAPWMRCPDPYHAQRGEPGFAATPRRFLELVQGPPNG